MMVMMHMIDRNKIDSSAPLTLALASSVSNDAQGDTLYFDIMTYNMVEDQPKS